MPHIDIDPKVCTALGKTADELASMTLREFFEVAYYRGYDVRHCGWDIRAKDGKLTVKMDDDARPIIHVDR